MKLTYLSHNHYAISDADAGRIARTQSSRKRLPRHGYELGIKLPDGQDAILKRTKLLLADPIQRKRGWVWTVMPTGWIGLENKGQLEDKYTSA